VVSFIINNSMAKSKNRKVADLLRSNASENLQFEGATEDQFETTIQVTDPTADRTITYPDDSGTVALTKNVPTLTAFNSYSANTNSWINDVSSDHETELANTNTWLLRTDSNLTATNTAIRSLVSDRYQVANAQSDLANTNSRLTSLEASVSGTTVGNTAFQSYVANTNTWIARTDTNLSSTNTAIRALITSNDSDISSLWSALTSTNTSIRNSISTEVAGLVDSAPATLDTLNELATALGDDANFSTTVTNSIATKMSVANTNTLVNDRMQVANTNTLVNDRMQVANTTLLVNDRLQVANATLDNIISTGNTTSRSLSVGGLEISYGGNPYKLPAGDGSASQILQTDGSGQASWVALEQAEGGGFVLGTLTAFPGTDGDVDYLEGGNSDETYVGSTGGSGTDAFGVSLEAVYDCMDPVGRIVTEDLGAFS